MKRLILIFGLLISVVGVLIMASPLLLRLTGLDKPVKTYLLSKIIKDGQGSAAFDEFRVGLGTLELNNVLIEGQDKNYLIQMPMIRFDFHFHDFFLHPSNPQIAIKSVTFVEPHLTLSKPAHSVPDSVTAIHKLDSLVQQLNRIEGIEQVLLEQGSVSYRTSNDEMLPLFTNINGQLSFKNLKEVRISAGASLLSSQKNNCQFNTFINLDSMQLNAELELLNFQAKAATLPPYLKRLKLQDGILNGKIKIELPALNMDSLAVDGQLEALDIALTYNQFQLEHTNFRLVFKNQTISLQKGMGQFNGAAFSVQIPEQKLFAETYDSRIHFPKLELAGLSSNIIKKEVRELDAFVVFNRLEKSVQSKLSVGNIEIGPDLKLSNVQANANYADGIIDLIGGKARIDEIQINGNGSWDLKSKDLTLGISANQESGTHVLLERLSHKKHHLQMNLSMNTKSELLRGNWSYRIDSAEDSLLDMFGRISGHFDSFELELLKSNFSTTKAFLRIKNVLSTPEIDQARLSNFPFSSFMGDAFIKGPLNRFNTELRLKGKLNNLAAEATFVEKGNERNDFRVNAKIIDLLLADKTVSGAIELKNLMGFYEFNLRRGIIRGSMDFPAGIKGNLKIDLLNQGKIDAGFVIHEFCVPAVLSDTVLSTEVLLQNQLSGNIGVEGTIKNPSLSAHLNADRWVFNNKGYYRTEVALHANEENLIVDTLKISLNNLPFVEGNFIARFTDRTLSGNFSGDQMDLAQILETLKPKNRRLSGIASYAMSLGGTFEQPKIAASGRIENGKLAGTDFTQLNFKFTDTLKDSGKIFEPNDHNIVIGGISMTGEGEYNLEAEGNLPLQDDIPLDVNLHFKGDALKFLPGWVPFFEGGTSIADIQLSLSGTRKEIRVKSGYCEIDRGELWLKSVAGHIEDIHGSIELLNGTNQVNIKNLKASVDGQEVTFNTVRNPQLASGRKLKNWYFNSIDLDFGILGIETAKGGVELNIPGLMRKNESGHIYLAGKNENENFYFAGPVKHPTAYGALTLYDAWLTYPFIVPKKKSNKKDVAVEFLKNMDWDVHLISGSDVRYRRDIPAYIDNVYTELYVDEMSPGLDFKGIINDGSFAPIGKLSSSRGRLEYLDQSFKVDYFSVEFTEWDQYPLVSGRAWTTIRDSVGAVPKTIYLRLYAVDEGTNTETAQGSLENFRFKLESADPQIGEDQEQVLSYMGFSVTNIKEKATSVGGSITERYLFRPLLRPLERALEQGLGVDMVRINSNIAKNLFYSSFGYNSQSNLFFSPFASNASYLFLMQSSDITIGKYLSKDLFFTYTGQLVSVYNQSEPELDFNHSFGLEYRFLRNVLVEIEYDRELQRVYRISSQKQYMDDFKIRLRHSFTF